MDKLASLLGLSRRANKLICGYDVSVEAIKNKKAVCALIANDISPKTEKNLRFEADKYGIEVIKLNISIEEAGKAAGKKAGVFVLTDEGFKRAVSDLNSK